VKSVNSPSTVAQAFWPVKSFNSDIGSYSPASMTHHKVFLSRNKRLIVRYSDKREVPYGVSSSYRILTKGTFHKYFDQIRSGLHNVIKLPDGEVQATLGLLRFWAYYGNVYPTAAHVASEAHCSKSTFWRAVMHLKALGLIKTVPRFVMRPHAQISNLYRLDRLVLLLARYLAEHGVRFWEKWLRPALTMPGQQFWSRMLGNRSPGPGCPAFDST